VVGNYFIHGKSVAKPPGTFIASKRRKRTSLEMKRKTILWLLIVAAILCAFLLPRILPSKAQSTSQVSNGKKTNGSKPVAVAVQTASLTSIEEKVLVTGTIRASNDIELRNEIAGRVTGVFFKEGMLVKKDQVLVTFNDRELQAQFLKANAVLKLVKDNESRQKGLFDKQIISTEEYQTNVKELESAEADVLILKAQLDKTKITAPFAGMIGLSSVSEGAFMSAGSKIANLISVDNMEVECAIPERHASFLKKGQRFTFTLSDNSSSYNAEVIAIEPKVDESTRSVALKARCLEKDTRLIAGTFVKVQLIVNQHQGFLVPGDAIISDIEGYKLFIAKDNQAIPVLVKTGFRDEKSVEIVSGLNTGDIYITTGAFLLRPKSKIEILDMSGKSNGSGEVSGTRTQTATSSNRTRSGESNK